MKNIYHIFAGFACCLLLSIVGCSKMNDLHDAYLQQGERIYTGRADTVIAHPGNERIKFSYEISDNRVDYIMIYWNNKSDSVKLSLPAKVGDYYESILEDMSEGNYTFEFVTGISDTPIRSLAREISTNIYGQSFQNSLQNRGVESATIENGNDIRIVWFGEVQYSTGVEIEYTESGGQLKRISVSSSENETVLENVDILAGVMYRTLFRPVPSAVDVFYTEFENISYEFEFDRSLFQQWNPVEIPYQPQSPAFPITQLWDSSTATIFAHQYMQFTFDMGQLAKLSRFRMHSRWENPPGAAQPLLYNIIHPKVFQLWGSDHPNVTDDFSSWVLLGEFTSIKPSGTPVGTITAADLAHAWTNGEEWNVPEGTPPVRYIRFVTLEKWYDRLTNGTPFEPIHISEMRIWGKN